MSSSRFDTALVMPETADQPMRRCSPSITTEVPSSEIPAICVAPSSRSSRKPSAILFSAARGGQQVRNAFRKTLRKHGLVPGQPDLTCQAFIQQVLEPRCERRSEEHTSE